MDLLIIGGSGFVSGTLAREAVAAGHAVWTVTRGARPVPEGCTSVVADRKDRDAFKSALTGLGKHFDCVIDCIAYELDDAKQDIDVLPGIADHLIFVSTDFVYDPARRRFPQPEDDAHYLTEGYGGRKRACELLLAERLGDGTSAEKSLRWTVFRPNHIYGPGSKLGCLPEHGRDEELIPRLRRGESLRLVGAGHFLQQPIFAPDLARLMLSAVGNTAAHGKIFNAPGSEIIESKRYYEIIADVLLVPLRIEEVPVQTFLHEHPERASFMCHRIYEHTRMREAGLAVPATSMEEGLRRHVEWMLAQE
jgi:nucleoside-diphosphate-sugar epimerase